eukprot:366426-Chlamydomonas_euryale.AAC.28
MHARMGAVVELYQPWAGPCKAILNTFKRIYFDAGDKPLKFFTVCGMGAAARPHVGREVDVEAVGEPFTEYKGKCQPVFLFYKVGMALSCHESESGNYAHGGAHGDVDVS